MSTVAIQERFLSAVEAWIADAMYLDLRYMALSVGGNRHQLLAGSIGVSPLPPAEDNSFEITTDKFIAGQVQRKVDSREELVAIVRCAASGEFVAHERALRLDGNPANHGYQSDMEKRDRWFRDLHLEVAGRERKPLSAGDAAAVDEILRRAISPFDGLADMSAWLQLEDPSSSSQPKLNIRVLPPVDLDGNACWFKEGALDLRLLAHPNLDAETVGLAIRAAPGKLREARRQIAPAIKWKKLKNGLKAGTAKVQLKGADSVLVMLTAGATTVRRNWFIDAAKARNHRYTAVQHFDPELKMVRQAVLEGNDSNRFELGVASLLFLMGFSSAVQLETNAPDLIVMTPAGRLVVIECTLRIADFAAKVGKLVDRRGALTKALQGGGHLFNVVAVLVCGLPKDQIAAQTSLLSSNKVVLIGREDLIEAFHRVRVPIDPDELLRQAEAQLVTGV